MIYVNKKEAMCRMAKKSSKRKKQLCDYASDQWRCQQLWLSKYGDYHCTTAKIINHICVQNYLNISQDVVIDYKDFIHNTNKKNKTATIFFWTKLQQSTTLKQISLRSFCAIHVRTVCFLTRTYYVYFLLV